MAKKVIDLAAGTVTIDFTKDGGEVHTIAASQVPGFGSLEGTALHALLHGLSQKIGDAYAAAKSQENPLEWAQRQVKATIAAIVAGTWNAGRTGEGGVRVSMLARALHRIKVAAGEESTEAEAQAFVDTLSKEQVAEYKGKKKVAKVLAEISLEDAQKRLERAAAKAAGITDEDDDTDEE